jgi:hypothetical protein
VRTDNDGEIWPHWSEGVPTKFRLMVSNQGRQHYEALELKCSAKELLSSLTGRNNSLLPSNKDESEWSGVYRIFLPDTPIDRFCGKDPTGTLYLGMAGTGAKGWSILNTRIGSIAKAAHHAIRDWRHSASVRKAYPGDTPIAVQWAFTEKRINFKGKNVGAKNAEGWLLRCYNDSYGEFPPLNQKG